jgi:hypothetical protein
MGNNFRRDCITVSISFYFAQGSKQFIKHFYKVIRFSLQAPWSTIQCKLRPDKSNALAFEQSVQQHKMLQRVTGCVLLYHHDPRWQGGCFCELFWQSGCRMSVMEDTVARECLYSAMADWPLLSGIGPRLGPSNYFKNGV